MDREKVIKGLEYCTQHGRLCGRDCNGHWGWTDGSHTGMELLDEYRTKCPYGNCETGCVKTLTKDALALLKAQTETINDLYGRYDGLCKEIREKYESDDVCGLCQYDGAYKGESGDWMNECPGFEANDCFCMKNSIRKMCGQPLIEEP